MRSDDQVKESSEIQIRDSGNQELADSLISDEGPLAVGLQPGARVANEAGEKALVESLTENDKAEKIKAKKAKAEKTEKAEPTTFEEPLVLPLVSGWAVKILENLGCHV